jgi:Tfp pilus assembly protein PilF
MSRTKRSRTIQSVSSLPPSSTYARNGRAFIYIKKGEFDKALEDCNEAIRLDPNYASAYKTRGIVYTKRVRLRGGEF